MPVGTPKRLSSGPVLDSKKNIGGGRSVSPNGDRCFTRRSSSRASSQSATKMSGDMNACDSRRPCSNRSRNSGTSSPVLLSGAILSDDKLAPKSSSEEEKSPVGLSPVCDPPFMICGRLSFNPFLCGIVATASSISTRDSIIPMLVAFNFIRGCSGSEDPSTYSRNTRFRGFCMFTFRTNPWMTSAMEADGSNFRVLLMFSLGALITRKILPEESAISDPEHSAWDVWTRKVSVFSTSPNL
mmetsp:Transcript_31623/g.88657  ORF Transcript_31623/g.88657 Transcript_31623/m.88657 type:complete len:241 (+) Transcript_31623:384-1106(+)